MSGPPPVSSSIASAAVSATAAPSVNQAVVADLASLPPALAQLTVGAQVEAEILSIIGQSVQVRTPQGRMTLQTAMSLPQGASLTLLTTAQGSPLQFRIAAVNGWPVNSSGQIQTPPPALPVSSPPAPRDEPAPPAPSLRESVEALRAALPQLAEQVERQLPALGHPRLAFQLLALTSAVRQGKAVPLFQGGEEGQAAVLSRLAARPEVLHGLEQGLASLRQTVTLPGSGPDAWQAYVLPFMVEGRERYLRLVVRDRPEGEAAARRQAEEGTRFLIDLDMTHLGPVQLDGLVKGRTKHFDLIIRTHAPIGDPLRMGIAEVFTRTLDGFGMTGRASFQIAAAFIEAVPISRPVPPSSA